MHAPAAAETYKLNGREVQLDGPYLGRLREANALLGDPQALRARMVEDGYLLVRGLLDRETVLGARRTVLQYLASQGQLDPSAAMMDGIPFPGKRGGYLGGRQEVTHQPGFLALAEAPALFSFFAALFGKPAQTFDYKWLRAVGAGQGTGAHYDVVYMGRGSLNLCTCWIPLGDVAFDEGPLAVLAGSHNLESYRAVQATYGRADVDRDNIDGNFTRDPLELVERFGGRWATTAYRCGDVLVFGMFTMHAALDNRSSRLRLSTDLRFQPQGEPIDERWIGRQPVGNYAWRKTPVVSIEESRSAWGV
ncbi:MAG: phytanoyl-CoA dioxygenase family protein [Planctomycetota bacterium]|nr:phytanoyl-CoA dioxygenase family protein [Planctomycetota bacterium]